MLMNDDLILVLKLSFILKFFIVKIIYIYTFTN